LLRTGGAANALELYENAFRGMEGSSEMLQSYGVTWAVRFLDPEERRDRAGRVIPHEFVVLDGDQYFDDVAAARAELWPRVADHYATIWDRREGPRPDASD